MEKLDKRYKNTDNNVEFKEEQRGRLSSNNVSVRCSSLDLGISPDSTQDELIGILADILVEAFMWQHQHGKEYTSESSNLLPGINKRTS
jgi:hypothetical protein